MIPLFFSTVLKQHNKDNASNYDAIAGRLRNATKYCLDLRQPTPPETTARHNDAPANFITNRFLSHSTSHLRLISDTLCLPWSWMWVLQIVAPYYVNQIKATNTAHLCRVRAGAHLDRDKPEGTTSLRAPLSLSEDGSRSFLDKHQTFFPSSIFFSQGHMSHRI